MRDPKQLALPSSQPTKKRPTDRPANQATKRPTDRPTDRPSKQAGKKNRPQQKSAWSCKIITSTRVSRVAPKKHCSCRLALCSDATLHRGRAHSSLCANDATLSTSVEATPKTKQRVPSNRGLQLGSHTPGGPHSPNPCPHLQGLRIGFNADC